MSWLGRAWWGVAERRGAGERGWAKEGGSATGEFIARSRFFFNWEAILRFFDAKMILLEDAVFLFTSSNYEYLIFLGVER